MTEGKGVVWVVVGPTGVGKTALGIELALMLQTEILGCDARQFYRGMEIGSAAPTAAEQARVVHHFVGHLEVTRDCSAGEYAAEARPFLEGLLAARKHAVVVGGSGLYLRALLDGLDEVPKDAAVRAALNARFGAEGLAGLLAQLDELDPAAGARIDRANPHRVIRALEATLAGGRPYSTYLTGAASTRAFDVVYIGLQADPGRLAQRIHLRTSAMLAAGWEAEARALLPYRDRNALRTVGYREWFACFDGALGEADLASEIELRTRQYAKRQMTWFRRLPEVQWFEAGATEAVLEWVEMHPKRNNPCPEAV